MGKVNKICQSCGMPLKKDENKEHELYCSHCWKNDQFVDPDLTLQKMQEHNFNMMTKDMKLPKWIANSFNKKVAKLKRWK